MQALIARGITGDFRPPDLMRFGFAPLYNSFEDAWLAATALGKILGTREWDQPDYLRKQDSELTKPCFEMGQSRVKKPLL